MWNFSFPFLFFLISTNCNGFVLAFQSRVPPASSLRCSMTNDNNKPGWLGDKKSVVRRTRRIMRSSISPSSTVTKTKAQAHELKISVDYPSTSPSTSSCYFEHDQMCSGATKSGICPVDSRPCIANRSYLDQLYKPPANIEHPLSVEEQEWQQQLQQWRQENGHEQQNFNHYDSGSRDKMGRDVDDLLEQRDQERLRLDIEEPRLHRFIYDIVDTIRIAMRIGKLVVNAVVNHVHVRIKENADRGNGRQQQ